MHCAAGVSRSASFTIAYIMKTKGKTFEDARQFVKSKRDVIHPNQGFQAQLALYEKKLRGEDAQETIKP